MKNNDFPIDLLRTLFEYDPLTGEMRRVGPRISKPFGYVGNHGYRTFHVWPKRFLAHTVAWALSYGVWPEMVDHINGTKSDNRLANLRLASKAQNAQNQRHRDPSAGLKGVHLKEGRHCAQIAVRGRKVHLGYFETEQAAAIQYDRAALYFHGEFAVTNYSLGLL